VTGSQGGESMNGNEDQYDLMISADRNYTHYLSELKRFQSLFFYLSWRDISVRYKQAVIGFLWTVLRPVFTMLIMSFVFGRLANLPANGAPYPILVFTGLLPWQLFSTSLISCGSSLVMNKDMVSKVYFPKMIIPLSTISVNITDFVISFVLMLLFMAYYHFVPSWHIVFLPIFILLVLIAIIGPGLLVAALNVRYRDFQFIVPFIVQVGMYISPVAYSILLVPKKCYALFALNPMVGIINGFRWCVIGGDWPLRLYPLVASGIMIVIFLLLGVIFFIKSEASFADRI